MTHSRKERTGQTGSNEPTLEERVEDLEKEVGALIALVATMHVDLYAHINQGENSGEAG